MTYFPNISWYCAGNVTIDNALQYQPCTPPAQFESLSDGEHTIYIDGYDEVGNWAQIEDAEFLVDTTPPSLQVSSYTVASNDGDLSVSFEADDGPVGSGIASVECR